MQQNFNALIALISLVILSACSSKSEPSTQPAATSAETKVSTQQDAVPLEPLAPLSASLQQAFLQALAAQQAQQWQHALPLWQQLQAQLPNYPGVLYNLALVQLQLNQLDNAQQTVQQLLKHSPKAVEGYNLSGAIARNQGQFREAEKQYLAALAIVPDHANAHKNLAFLYDLYLAEPIKARQHYERYQALTNDEQVKLWLGVLPQQESNP